MLARLAGLVATAPLNLVSGGDRPRVRRLHVDESAAVADLLVVPAGSHWLDLGTGGGLPGLVLAILFPMARWTLLDATMKKVVAVDGFIDQLGLTNAATVVGRAETLAREDTLRGRFDGVVSRAVAPLPALAELSRGFVRPGGLVAAIKGSGWAAEVARTRPILDRLQLTDLHSIQVPGTERPTWLVTMRARGTAPPAVPRGNGVPQSSPLEGARS